MLDVTTNYAVIVLRGAGVTSVLVVTEFFPTIIQPWLLNSVEQICRRGRATIAAGAPGLGPIPQKVVALGLLGRTIYCPMTGGSLVKSLFSKDILFNVVVQAQFWRGLSLLRTPLSNIPTLLKHLALARVAGFDQYDIIHAHHEISAYEFLPVAKALNIPMVLTFHGKPPPGVAELSMLKRGILYKAVAHVQVNTQFAAAQVIDLGCPSEKIRILPQGIDLAHFPYSPLPPIGSEELLTVLTVARVQRDKGHQYAIDAIANLVRAGHRVEYRIVGGGPEEQSLRDQIKALGMERSIKMLGPLSDCQLAEEYRSAHVFILPSLRDLEGKHEETQGVVIQEAQASGKIVIATITGGVPECVDNGVSAFLVPDRSAPAFEAAILNILKQPSLWQKWQEQGRQWVEKHFDINVIGEKQWQLYLQAITLNRDNAQGAAATALP